MVPHMSDAVSPLPDHVRASPWGWRGGSFHHGVDLFAPEGSPVVAARAGTVLESVPSGAPGFDRYGATILLDHGPVRTLYAHLSARTVRSGETVQRGQIIGRVGQSAGTTAHPERTFHSSDPHLHFEVLVGPYPASAGPSGPDARSRDPARWLAEHGATLRTRPSATVPMVAMAVGLVLGGIVVWRLPWTG